MNYGILLQSANELFKDEPNNLSLLSNASAFIKQNIDHLNWVGFYLYTQKDLTLGPFQGKVACNIIPPGKGVVGTGYLKKEIIVVEDVNKIENHIMCDPLSQSEVVVPIMHAGKVWAIFDIDAPVTNRFDQDLVHFLQQFGQLLEKYIDFNAGLI